MKRKNRPVVLFLFVIFFVLSGFVNESSSGRPQVDGGYRHSLWVRSDGTLWAWGWNDHGQLGDGTTTQRTSPVRIGSDKNWVAVSAGEAYSVGVRSDGTLWAWGWNNYAKLEGRATKYKNAERYSPVQIDSDNKWVVVSAKGSYSFGLKSSGTLWAWGLNDSGRLGDGTSIHRHSPIQIGSDRNWVAVSAGRAHNLGVRSDGTLWAWGWNAYGQLGDGTTTQRTSPVQIGSDKNWVAVSAGTTHSLGVRSDGTLWAWGSNKYGQLGDGTNEHNNAQRRLPIQIGSDKNWVAVSAGRAHSLGVRSDGTLWAWGLNDFGELGDGTTIHRHSPIQITLR